MSTVVEKNEKRSKNVSVPVHPATRDELSRFLERVNAKKFGRTVRFDEAMARAVKKLDQDDVEALQQGSLTNSDRVSMRYENYIEENGPISRDEFLGLVIAGKVPLS